MRNNSFSSSVLSLFPSSNADLEDLFNVTLSFSALSSCNADLQDLFNVKPFFQRRRCVAHH